MTDPILQRRKQVQTSNCRGHWLTGSSWTFLTSRSHRHSIKKNHAGSTCRMDPSLRTLPHSHPGHASGWEGRIGKDTYSHRGGEGTKPYRVLHVCPGVWTMHGKTSKASGRRLPGQRGRKHGLKKKRAKETERTFCDWKSEGSRERCKGPCGASDRAQALQRAKQHTRLSNFSPAPWTPGAMVRSEL